jgi:putative hydrolase
MGPKMYLPSMDLHIHTELSGHAHQGTDVRSVIQVIHNIHLSVAAITEHVEKSSDAWRINTIRNVIKELSAVDIMVGAEIAADPIHMDGRLVIPPSLPDVDIVIATIHHYPGTTCYWYENLLYSSTAKEALLNQWLEWSVAIVSSGHVDILAHPGLLLLKTGMIWDDTLISAFEKLLLACKAYQVAFELNESLFRKFNPEQLNGYKQVFCLAKELGVKISLGSDAHSLDEIGFFPWSRKIIDELELSESDFISFNRGK